MFDYKGVNNNGSPGIRSSRSPVLNSLRVSESLSAPRPVAGPIGRPGGESSQSEPGTELELRAAHFCVLRDRQGGRQ